MNIVIQESTPLALLLPSMYSSIIYFLLSFFSFISIASAGWTILCSILAHHAVHLVRSLG